MRLFSLTACAALGLLILPAIAQADDEPHPFGPRPSKDGPVDDPFVQPFGDAEENAQEDVAPQRPATADPLGISDDPFGGLPDEAFKPRPAVDGLPTTRPVASDPPPAARPEESFELQLDLNGDGNITDIEVAAAIDNILKDAKSRTPRGEQIRAAFDINKDKKVEPAEVVEKVVAERIARDLSAARVAEMFASLDANGDRHLDSMEFLKIAELIGVPAQFAAPVLKQRFTALDRDGDFKVSLAEAVLSAEGLTSRWGRGGAGESDEAAMARAQEVLEELDRDKNNEISRREAARNDGLKNFFTQIDTDGDDAVILGEMYEFLRTQARQAAEEASRQDKRDGWERFGRGFPGRSRDRGRDRD